MTAKLLAISFVLLLLFVWFVLTVGEAERRVISPSVLPSPLEVFGSLPGLISERHHPCARTFWLFTCCGDCSAAGYFGGLAALV